MEEIVISRSPVAYGERKGFRPTRREPEARYMPTANRAMYLPAAAPSPSPAALLPVRQPGSPDTGGIRPWPAP